MNKIEAALVSALGVLLLLASFSGFMSDAEISSQRLGSDFSDSSYHRFSELSSDRAEQRTRRQQVGMEAVGGLGLLVLSIVAYKPKRADKPTRFEVSAPPASARVSEPMARTREIADPSRRRRPNGDRFARPQKAA